MDALNLSQAQIHNSPADIASWPVTEAITGLWMDARGGLTLTFSPALPDAWKWASNPASPADNFQFTVWAVVQLPDGSWHAAGFVQMWQGRPMGDGSLPPILSGYPNWWGDPRALWGAMSGYVPKAGDQVGFFVSAGNARLVAGVTSVRERSNVVAVRLPAGDVGAFAFDPVAPPAPPDPPPLSAPGLSITIANLVVAVQQLQAQVAALTTQFATLAAKPPASVAFPNYQASLFGATVVLKPQK